MHRCAICLLAVAAVGGCKKKTVSCKEAVAEVSSIDPEDQEVMIDVCKTDHWSTVVLDCMIRERSVVGCGLSATDQRHLDGRILIHRQANASKVVAPADAALPDAAMAIDAAMPATPVETRLRGYAKLLAIDFTIFQTIAAFPKTPANNVFKAYDFRWRSPTWIRIDAFAKEVEAILASTDVTPNIAADAPVRLYAKALADQLTALVSLHDYYDRQLFVDDEFERGRREAPHVAKIEAELAKLRAPMRAAVFAAWRELVADHPDGPRAVIGHAWEACMAVSDRIMENVADEAISKAVSECRRSIPKISNVGASTGFDRDVRAAAVGLGDWVAQGHPTWNFNASDALGKLTQKYFDLWPTLPVAPAEMP